MTATQIILLITIVVLIVFYPILIRSRNRKETEKIMQQTNSLKRGDKVLTTSGIVGTIVDLHLEDERKLVTIETGMGKYKGYFTIEAFAIYKVLEDEKIEQNEDNTKSLAPVNEETVSSKPSPIEVEAKKLGKTLKKGEGQGRKTKKVSEIKDDKKDGKEEKKED